jgi:tRNA U34 2-thiouridine synthase MnmA/TrmU
MKKRAISLISGGLDSAVATKLIIEQGIEVIGLHFTSIFASKRDKQRGHMALRTARELGIEIVTKNKGDDYIEIVKNPRYGYGKNMNPASTAAYTCSASRNNFSPRSMRPLSSPGRYWGRDPCPSGATP